MSFALIYRETAIPGISGVRRKDETAFRRMRTAIRALAQEPYPDGAVPWGNTGYWRLHAGNVRILYEVNEEKSAVYIINVGLMSLSDER